MVICDYAVVTPDQKLTMVGTFDRILASQVPVAVPALGVAARLRDVNVRVGKNHHDIELRIKAADGTVMANVQGGMDAQVDASPEGGLCLPIGLMFQGLVFPKYGEYRVELWLDKQRAHSLPVWISKPLNPQAVATHGPNSTKHVRPVNQNPRGGHFS